MPPDIDGVTWERINGLPTTLQAGATQEIVIGFAVAGCDVDLGAYDVMPVRAASGLAPSRVVRIPAPGWLMDAVSSACGTPTDGIGP